MDDIWKEMNEADDVALSKYKNATRIITNIPDVIKKVKDPQKGKKKAAKQDSNLPLPSKPKKSKKTVSTEAEVVVTKKLDFKELPESDATPNEVIQLIIRDINCMDDMSNQALRRTAVKKIIVELFEKYQYSISCYNAVLREIAKPLFKRFEDDVEKVREYAYKLFNLLVSHCGDVQPVLPYYIPALVHRLPSPISYDEEMKVFVFDMEAHDAYRRGKAIARQDNPASVADVSMNTYHCSGKETSEEIRLMACQGLGLVIRRAISIGACHIIHPFFHEIILFLQAQLRDTFPDLKVEALHTIQILADQTEYVIGMKYFAVALSRAILPVLRHRHAKVRAAAVSCIRATIAVPDADKCKGAGTEAIMDLVGFREENNLSVASFYVSEVRVNYLAELVVDKSVAVRENLVVLLTVLLTSIGDRYDHQNRLLPYLLDLLCDDTPSVADAALKCLKYCGQQYEEEHGDDIIEKRQYGIDGDATKINLDKPPVAPFLERPRIGVRLYVRGNCKRFLNALVGELTNWVANTRLKSAGLLKLIIYLCEEHLTMEAFTLFPSLIKAIHFARQDNDKPLHQAILEVCELIGRFTLPETYIHYVLPRLKGDLDVLQYGSDVNMRISILQMLSALLSGSRANMIAVHFSELIDALTDPRVIDLDSSVPLRVCVLDVILTVLHALVRTSGRGKAAIEAHYLATGRLTTLQQTVYKLFQFLLLNMSSVAVESIALGVGSMLVLPRSSVNKVSSDVDVGVLRDRSAVAMILLSALEAATAPVIVGITDVKPGLAQTSQDGTVVAPQSVHKLDNNKVVNKLCSLVLVGVNDIPLDTYYYADYVLDLQKLFTAQLPKVVSYISNNELINVDNCEDWELDSWGTKLLRCVAEYPLLLYSVDATILASDASNSSPVNTDTEVVKLCQQLIHHCCANMSNTYQIINACSGSGSGYDNSMKVRLREMILYYTTTLTVLMQQVVSVGLEAPTVYSTYQSLLGPGFHSRTLSTLNKAPKPIDRSYLLSSIPIEAVIDLFILSTPVSTAEGAAGFGLFHTLVLDGDVGVESGLHISTADVNQENMNGSASGVAVSAEDVVIDNMTMFYQSCKLQLIELLLYREHCKEESVCMPPALLLLPSLLSAKYKGIISSILAVLALPPLAIACNQGPLRNISSYGNVSTWLSLKLSCVDCIVTMLCMASFSNQLAVEKERMSDIEFGHMLQDAWTSKLKGALLDYPRVKHLDPSEGSETSPLAAAVLTQFLNLLGDSSSVLRIKAVDALHYLVPFVKKSTPAVDNTVGFQMMLKNLVVRLISDCKYLAVESEQSNGNDHSIEAYVMSIDSVIRSLILLDPLESSAIIRNEFENFISDQKSGRVNEMISGLLDHCEMMAQFSKC